MEKLNVIQACFLNNEHCEYCAGKCEKVYLPLHKSVLNPARICQECVVDYNIVDWFDSEEDYRKALSQLKNDFTFPL